MSIEAETAEQAEQLVAEQLSALVAQTPELKDKFGQTQSRASTSKPKKQKILNSSTSPVCGVFM